MGESSSPGSDPTDDSVRYGSKTKAKRSALRNIIEWVVVVVGFVLALGPRGAAADADALGQAVAAKLLDAGAGRFIAFEARAHGAGGGVERACHECGPASLEK